MRTQSVTQAAARLNLTQSAVSHQIAQFEAWMGSPLFERRGRALHPTAIARSLFPQLTATIGELDAILNAARHEAARRDLRVSAPPEVVAQWLGRRLEVFARDNPELDLTLVQEYRRATFAGGSVDLQIRLGQPSGAQEGFALFADEEFAVCAPALAARLPPRRGFAVAPLLSFEGARHTSLDWQRWLIELFGGEDEDPGQVRETSRFEMAPPHRSFDEMIAACRRGEGFALVRSLLVADDLAEGTLSRCFDESLPSDLAYHVVHACGGHLRPAVAAFIGWLRQEADLSRARMPPAG